jgi:hypothetical protein
MGTGRIGTVLTLTRCVTLTQVWVAATQRVGSDPITIVIFSERDIILGLAGDRAGFTVNTPARVKDDGKTFVLHSQFLLSGRFYFD